MGVLETAIDHRSQPYLAARAEMLAALASLETALDAAREGGGERAVTRHHARGKLLARERVELLVDRDSPLLELSPVAGWGSGAPVGAAVVTAIGVVEDQPCVIVADDATVPAGAITLRKVGRAQQIALENRLPLINLAESAATDPPDPGELHLAEQVAAGAARLAVARIPTVTVCFGTPRDAGSTYTIALRTVAPVPADDLAEDDRDALRLARQCARRFPRGAGIPAPRPAVPPKHDPEDLLAATEPREILGRVLDGSTLDEIHPDLCGGWGELAGYPVAVLTDSGDAGQAARLVRLAADAGTPLLLLQQGEGTATAAAVAEAGVPLVAVRAGGHPAAVRTGSHPALARFRFAWPTAGRDTSALHWSGQLLDDGVVDPRDTRAVLGMCLSVMRP